MTLLVFAIMVLALPFLPTGARAQVAWRMAPQELFTPWPDCTLGDACGSPNAQCMQMPSFSCVLTGPNPPSNCPLRYFLDADGDGCGCCWN
jgi:hypothetical protein